MLHQLTSDLAPQRYEALMALFMRSKISTKTALVLAGQCIKRTLRIIGRLVTRDD